MLAGKIWPNGEAWVGHIPRPPQGGANGLGRPPQKSQRGLKGITGKGRRIVRNGCYLLEDLYGTKNLSFLTCTLPGSTKDECARANRLWGEVVRRFIQELKRELERFALAPWIVGCTEIQPGRYERTGQPWPHLHLVFPGKINGRWALTTARATTLWARVCNAVLDIPIAECAYATTLKPVRGNGAAAKYLSKYMSKGGSDLASIHEACPDIELPHQWHHCSHSLNDLIRKGIKQLCSKSAAWLCKLAQTPDSGFKVFAVIDRPSSETHQTHMPLGYYGMLDPDLITRIVLYDAKERNLWPQST